MPSTTSMISFVGPRRARGDGDGDGDGDLLLNLSDTNLANAFPGAFEAASVVRPSARRPTTRRGDDEEDARGEAKRAVESASSRIGTRHRVRRHEIHYFACEKYNMERGWSRSRIIRDARNNFVCGIVVGAFGRVDDGAMESRGDGGDAPAERALVLNELPRVLDETKHLEHEQ